jgi:hypothetical protein
MTEVPCRRDDQPTEPSKPPLRPRHSRDSGERCGVAQGAIHNDSLIYCTSPCPGVIGSVSAPSVLSSASRPVLLAIRSSGR